MRRAFVTGATGQDASYLSELLLSEGYEVHGLVRRASMPTRQRLAAILNHPRFVLHTGDLTDALSVEQAIGRAQPDEIYNLAAMSDVHASWEIPEYTKQVNSVAYTTLLTIIRRQCASAKVYQACSSEMFGAVLQTPQTVDTPHNPLSPYGESKHDAWIHGRNCRRAYGMRVYNGILFNHESPRRGEQFVSRKICKAVARIKNGLQDRLVLGNLEAKRDWGYAKEYAYWIWRIVQSDVPDDFLISTGETHSVREFVELAFSLVDLDWNDYVDYDPSLLRPGEVDLLWGKCPKARRVLGFEPKVKFAELTKIMVEAELEECSNTKTTAAA